MSLINLPMAVPAKVVVPNGMFQLAELESRLSAARSAGFAVRLLVTGSRDWTRGDIIEAVVRALPPGSIVVHGGASGADSMAEFVVQRFAAAEPGRQLSTEVHRANWSQGRKAGPLRNAEMVRLGADCCVAFPLENSRGTWDCAHRAMAAGIPTFVAVL